MFDCHVISLKSGDTTMTFGYNPPVPDRETLAGIITWRQKYITANEDDHGQILLARLRPPAARMA